MILEQLPEIQRLPPAQKRQLAEELWLDTEDSNEVEVDPSVLALLDARLADFASGNGVSSSWKEVAQRVFRHHDA